MRKSNKHPFLSASQEIIVRHTVQVVLPAFGALYFALAPSWGLPESENVVGTTAAIAAFLGTVLGINHRRLPDSGELHVEEDDAGYQRITKMALDASPEEISKMREVRFKIQTPK